MFFLLKRYIVVSLVFVVLLTSCSEAQKADSMVAVATHNTSSKAGTPVTQKLPLVPDFTLDSNTARAISLSDYKGSVVVLNFWATWCPPCKTEMPDFVRLHEAFKKEGDVVLLMLNQTDGQRETRKKADAYITDNIYPFTVLYDDGRVGWTIFGIQSIPTTVVIDAEGRLSSYVMGATSYSRVMKMVENAR